MKTCNHFPSDDAATKLAWPTHRNITAAWGPAAKEWREAMDPFAIAWGRSLYTNRRVVLMDDLSPAARVRREAKPAEVGKSQSSGSSGHPRSSLRSASSLNQQRASSGQMIAFASIKFLYQ